MNKNKNEIKASEGYSIGDLLNATKELCSKILVKINEGNENINLSEINYNYDNIINDCDYFLNIMDKISENGKELNRLLGKLIYRI